MGTTRKLFSFSQSVISHHFATCVRWAMNCNSSLGGHLVEAAEVLVVPSSCGCFRNAWDHGSLCFLQFSFTIPSGGKYLVLDLISALFTAVHTPEVTVPSSYGVLAAIKHSLSYGPWYHNRFESVSLLGFHILPLVNRDEHLLFIPLPLPPKGWLCWHEVFNIFFHK